jgi:hypothetical protein
LNPDKIGQNGILLFSLLKQRFFCACIFKI